jgi:hypothetical protein
MARVKVDFSKARDFEALPVGAYPVTVEATEIRDGKNYPYINWEFKVKTGEFAGRKLWMISSMSPDATWSLKAALRALGETNPALDSDEFEMDPDDYLGREAIANVTQEEYNDRMQNRVESLTPAGASSSGGGGGRRAPAGIR